MKMKLLALLVISLFLVSCSKSKKEEGQDCTSNDDCLSGICLNIAEVEDSCSGMVCVKACQNEADCTLEERPDCEGISGDRRVCLYRSWEARFCGGN
ncbi:MAG: hypothetical protein JW797_04125 [Bradymonadales bacterium]|nr:hypothetical protein [Bradymonadales bacterium]